MLEHAAFADARERDADVVWMAVHAAGNELPLEQSSGIVDDCESESFIEHDCRV